MKLSTIIATTAVLCAVGLFSAKAEARSHVSFGFNFGCCPVVQERVYVPQPVYYVPCQPVYAAPVYAAPVYATPVYGEMHVVPGYRERAMYPRGYWR